MMFYVICAVYFSVIACIIRLWTSGRQDQVFVVQGSQGLRWSHVQQRVYKNIQPTLTMQLKTCISLVFFSLLFLSASLGCVYKPSDFIHPEYFQSRAGLWEPCLSARTPSQPSPASALHHRTHTLVVTTDIDVSHSHSSPSQTCRSSSCFFFRWVSFSQYFGLLLCSPLAVRSQSRNFVCLQAVFARKPFYILTVLLQKKWLYCSVLFCRRSVTYTYFK